MKKIIFILLIFLIQVNMSFPQGIRGCYPTYLTNIESIKLNDNSFVGLMNNTGWYFYTTPLIYTLSPVQITTTEAVPFKILYDDDSYLAFKHADAYIQLYTENNTLQLYAKHANRGYLSFPTDGKISVYSGSVAGCEINLDIQPATGIDATIKMGDTGTAGEFTTVDSVGIINAPRIGINTATPDSLLEVNGSIVANGSINYGEDAQANDTYVLSIGGITSYHNLFIIAKMNTANTGACTININSIGAADIKTASGADPADNDILAGIPVILIHNGTQFILINPATTCD